MEWEADLDDYYAYVQDGGAVGSLWGAVPPDPKIAQWRSWWRRRAVNGRVVFRGDELVGVTRSARRHALATHRWASAGRGALACFDVRDTDPFVEAARRHALLALGATSINPQLVVCGRSAAVLHGLPLKACPDRLELTRRGHQRPGPSPRRSISRAQLAEAEIAQWWAAPVTTVARTLLDLARSDGEEAIIAADAALRARLVTRSELSAALERAAGWPGVRRARDVLSLASPQAESPLESLARLVLHDAGFPSPQLQLHIDPYDVDLAWPALSLIIEADGLLKYTGRRGDAARAKEKHREQVLRRAGYRVERVTWRDLTRDRDSALVYLREVFATQASARRR